MKETEAKRIAKAILLVDKYRRMLPKLDRLRDANAFNDEKRVSIEKNILDAEASVREIRSYLRRFGVDLL